MPICEYVHTTDFCFRKHTHLNGLILNRFNVRHPRVSKELTLSTIGAGSLSHWDSNLERISYQISGNETA